MPFYESVLIARPDISAAQVESLTQDLTRIVEENGGKVAKTEYWGVKTLAYRIKKNRKGHYAMLNLDAPAGALAELERNMRLNEDVIRYMSVRVDALEEGPSIMMQNRGGRGRDRDRRGRREGGGAERDGRPAAAGGKTAAASEDGKTAAASEAAPEAVAGERTEG